MLLQQSQIQFKHLQKRENLLEIIPLPHISLSQLDILYKRPRVYVCCTCDNNNRYDVGNCNIQPLIFTDDICVRRPKASRK